MEKEKDWNLFYIEDLAKRIVAKLDEYYDESLEFVDEDGDIDLNEANAFDSSLETLLEEDNLDEIIASVHFEPLAELVYEMFDQGYFDRKEDEIKEVYKESVEYSRDPLAYYGMSQKDFL